MTTASLDGILLSLLSLLCVAGFIAQESGMVRAKNATTVALKHVLILSTSTIMFYVIGYNLMALEITKSSGLWGSARLLMPEAVASSGQWFLPMIGAVIAGSIVSGTLSERLGVYPFFCFIIWLSGLIYPLAGAWAGPHGWLSGIGAGFRDVAGAASIHALGGCCALAGALILGPRLGKYGAQGKNYPLPGSNIPLAALGGLLLWCGWTAFVIGRASMAHGDAGLILLNVTLCASCACIVATLYTMLRFRKPDITFVLNGTLAGLVSISACPDIEIPLLAMAIGALAGVFCIAAISLFDRFKIDDVTGSLSVHLVGGIWGTLAVGLFAGGDLLAQAIGIGALCAYSTAASGIIWLILKRSIGIRVTERTELEGTDRTETGIQAYADFDIRA